ncbi:MAG: DUF1592 domain-containing protein, partial [Bryobacteraceae bacterium]
IDTLGFENPFRRCDIRRYVPAALILLAAWPSCLAQPEAVSFVRHVYPILEDAGCRACHSPDGVASATRLQFPELGARAEQVERFGKWLVILVEPGKAAESLLVRKPTNLVAHAGGEKIAPQSREATVLRAWASRLAQMSTAERAQAIRDKGEMSVAGPAPPKAAVRRLTSSQYNNTVRDLLGSRTAPANQFPPEDFVNGYRNQYDAQSLSPMLAEAYGRAAEKLAKDAFRPGMPALYKCRPGPACRSEFVREFGLRAFRRPLDAAELRRYEALFAAQADFARGVQMVVEVMLQSPNFLFRLEETDNPAWKPYAAASRLSYTLWDSMPDDDLLRRAASGELSTPAGFEKVARAMLTDQKARQALDEFVSQWLRFDRVLAGSKNRRKFPNFTTETAAAMAKEARLFVADLVWNDRNFMEIFTAGHGFPNGDLARLYGVNPPAGEFERVDFPPESERGGLLGQALFLTLTSKPDETSPTARGLFVREQFLCQHVADPPPGVDTNLPPASADKPMTNQERLALHAGSPSCAGCHSLIDPIGVGFEKFDAVGARREMLRLVFRTASEDDDEDDDKKARPRDKTVDLELKTSGFVAGIRDSAFGSPRDLGRILAASPACQECVVKQYFRYAGGRGETPADRPQIKAVAKTFRESGFRFRELIISMLRTLQFPDDGESANVATR